MLKLVLKNVSVKWLGISFSRSKEAFCDSMLIGEENQGKILNISSGFIIGNKVSLSLSISLPAASKFRFSTNLRSSFS